VLRVEIKVSMEIQMLLHKWLDTDRFSSTKVSCVFQWFLHFVTHLRVLTVKAASNPNWVLIGLHRVNFEEVALQQTFTVHCQVTALFFAKTYFVTQPNFRSICFSLSTSLIAPMCLCFFMFVSSRSRSAPKKRANNL